ncbi:conserved exported hypothetical protein [Candidatus Sulfopaludibacter sp. SbA3]|nr:conserved exported hypothetical protein [Candidatus Sulfopaludibacter sp. SbA3]
MRPFLGIALALGIFAAIAMAQDNLEQQKVAARKAQVEIDQMLRGAKVLGIEGAIMGPAVKGAPYSADEIHETNQVLADGTRIHNETKTAISRDGQGRVRRESPGQVMIWDSTGGSSFMLNQSNLTAQKMTMDYTIRKKFPAGGSPEPQTLSAFGFSNNNGSPAMVHQMVIVKGTGPEAVAEAKAELRGAGAPGVKKETLDSQIIEGVTCEGVRLTTTIEAGAIGNDRPIQSTEESWYSPELQVNLLVRKNDPRTGEDTVRLTNVRRLEPDPGLFTVPPGYQVK